MPTGAANSVNFMSGRGYLERSRLPVSIEKRDGIDTCLSTKRDGIDTPLSPKVRRDRHVGLHWRAELSPGSWSEFDTRKTDAN